MAGPRGFDFPITTNRSLLAVRFWDHALDIPVIDGLEVRVWSENDPSSAVLAVRGGSGVYTFRSLPGLREPYTGSQKKAFVMGIRDSSGRFLETAVRLLLPGEGSGLVSDVMAVDKNGFHLFASPGRIPPSGFARIRGRLWHKTVNRPASFALVEALHVSSQRAWYGVSDGRGCFALILPYPVIGGAMEGTSLSDQKWRFAISVFSSAEAKEPLLGVLSPDINEILKQPLYSICPNEDGPLVTSLEQDVFYGRDLVLRSQIQEEKAESSVLCIAPGLP